MTDVDLQGRNSRRVQELGSALSTVGEGRIVVECLSPGKRMDGSSRMLRGELNRVRG